MLRLFSAGILVFALGLPAAAQSTSRIGPLYEALGLPALLEIMREEGMGYGSELERDLFPGRGRAAWEARVGEIYALKRMEGEVTGGLDAGLTDQEIAGVLEFFDSAAGTKIVALETAARRAMLDEDVEAAAHDGWLAIEAEDGPRWAQLNEFAELNDLVESNVAGAMTSNYEFYMGLIDGKAFEFEMTEGEVLADVWSQEQAIREETVDWVYSFTSLAYQPLSDAEFQAYVTFSATPEGRALNAALFTAFNDMFAGISRELGRGAARYLAGQDI